MILQDIIHDKQFTRKLLAIMLPISFQHLMLALVAVSDTAMLIKVSQNDMAAVSLATQIQFIQNILLSGMTGAIAVLGAQYWGKKDIKVLAGLFGLSVRESALLCLVFFIACYLFPEKLMILFTRDEKLIMTGAEYLKIASWSYLIAGTSQCYMGIMRISEHAARSACISSLTVFLNIGLNALFIFGLCGFPAMGVRGAALATALARAIELLLSIASTFQKGYIRLQLNQVFHFNRGLIREFWYYALPVLSAYLLWSTGFTTYTAIIGHLGADAAAANGIVAVVRDVACCLCYGLSNGIGIIIGNELGAGNLERGRQYGQRALALSGIFGLSATLLILAMIPAIAGAANLTEQAHSCLVGMLAMLAFYMIGKVLCTVVIDGVFKAGGDTRFDVYSLCVAMWGIALPCAFFCAFVLKLPVLTVFGCTCMDEVAKSLWVLHHYKKYKWVKNITKETF